MRVVIPGGTGQVGTILARSLHRDGYEVVVLSRDPRPAPWRVARWDAETLGGWAADLDGADAVINLAGRSVNCRYNAENRRAIKESRVNSTRAVGEAVARASRPPRVWLQRAAGSVGEAVGGRLFLQIFRAARGRATSAGGGGNPGFGRHDAPAPYAPRRGRARARPRGDNPRGGC